MVFVRNQSNGILSFQRGLVETREGSPSVGWLHLSRCDIFGATVLIFIRRAIEACHFLVEIACKLLRDLRLRPTRYDFLEREGGGLGVLIVSDLR